MNKQPPKTNAQRQKKWREKKKRAGSTKLGIVAPTALHFAIKAEIKRFLSGLN